MRINRLRTIVYLLVIKVASRFGLRISGLAGGVEGDVTLNETPEKGLLNPGDGPPFNPTTPWPPGPGRATSKKAFSL